MASDGMARWELTPAEREVAELVRRVDSVRDERVPPAGVSVAGLRARADADGDRFFRIGAWFVVVMFIVVLAVVLAG